jgi:hypothetical protein
MARRLPGRPRTLALGAYSNHVPDEPEPLEAGYDPGGRVGLPAVEAWMAEVGKAW